jgi:iron complex transport system substrate-binding protein
LNRSSLGRRLAALICLLTFAPVCLAQPIAVTDDRGRVVRLPVAARRIVVLAPNLAELSYDAGAGSALAGVVRGSDYPAPVARLPAVGDAAGIDLERVLSLRPDLVLAWLSGNRASDLERIEGLGIPVYGSEPRRLRDVPATLRRLGTLAGTKSQAERAAVAFEAGLSRLSARAQTQPLSVFVQIWDSPLMTVNEQHLISDVLAACGGRNVFAGLPTLAGSVSLEAVLAADPAVIIVATAPGQDATAAWRRLPRLRAVQAGRVHAIDPDLIARATPRILDGVEKVCGWLRPM